MDCKLVYLLFHPSAWGFIFPVDSSDIAGKLSLLLAAASCVNKICSSLLSTAGCLALRRFQLNHALAKNTLVPAFISSLDPLEGKRTSRATDQTGSRILVRGSPHRRATSVRPFVRSVRISLQDLIFCRTACGKGHGSLSAYQRPR